MRKVVFMGSKQIGHSCLQHLIEQREALDIEMIAVFTNPKHIFGENAAIIELCNMHEIKMMLSLEEFQELPEFDILFSVQYHEILRKEHLEKVKQVAVNLHLAPLPEYRGCNQFTFAILDEVEEFGATIHILDEKVDSGDIIFESRFPIPDHCYVKELYEKTIIEGICLFQDNAGNIIQGDYLQVRQVDLVKERGTSFHFRNEIDKIKEIDLKWDSEKIERYIRATTFPPFDPPFSMIEGKKTPVTIENYKELSLQ